jgi:hypothetical protein
MREIDRLQDVIIPVGGFLVAIGLRQSSLKETI